jgi:hypothetical protein
MRFLKRPLCLTLSKETMTIKSTQDPLQQALFQAAKVSNIVLMREGLSGKG